MMSEPLNWTIPYPGREKVNDILEDIRDLASVASGAMPMSESSQSPLDGIPRDAINDILEDIRDYMRIIAENISGSGPGGSRAYVGLTPPIDPQNGQLWFNPSSALTFIWYDDGSSAQWVQVVP
jgi:hypothetical protein